MALESVQEGDEFDLLLVGQIHLKTLVVEVDELREILRSSIVEIWRPRGEATKDGAFDTVDVAALPREERFARIGGVDDVGINGSRIERIGAAFDFVDRQIGKIELRGGTGNDGIGFVSGIVSGADIERKREGVITDIGRVVTGGAVADERCDGHRTKSRIVVEATDAGDGERASIEQDFSSRDHLAVVVIVIIEEV